jgi:tetratricopeptide (TPR) repeat protein
MQRTLHKTGITETFAMAVAQQEIEQATALAQQGNSEAAVALLSQLIQRDASNPSAWLALAEVVDDPERAEYCLQKVLSLDPGNAVALEKLSKTKGGSLSVGSVGGLNPSDSSSAHDPAPAAVSEGRQDVDSADADLSEPVPQIFSEAPKQDELHAMENPAEASGLDATKPEESQEKLTEPEALTAAPTSQEDIPENVDSFEYEVATPESLAQTSNTDAVEAEGFQDSEAQLDAAVVSPDEPSSGAAGRSSVGRTDLILIGLTVLAGIVLCALVSAALIT